MKIKRNRHHLGGIMAAAESWRVSYNGAVAKRKASAAAWQQIIFSGAAYLLKASAYQHDGNPAVAAA